MIEINYNDKLYPDKLRKIKNPPMKIYAEGNVELLKKDGIAVVGTREISQYGIINCQNIVKEITIRNIPVISGMAIGTDTIAHETCLKYGGETIAVLGCGFKNIFPKENTELFQKILAKNGLIISEYSPDVIARSEFFLERNRIVSGISVGVLVIEAAHRSGTSVTANLAKNQGKVLMALPGRLDECHGVGVNRLIQNGAKLVTDIDDILINFPQFMDKMWKKDKQEDEQKDEQMRISNVKEEYKEILKLIEKNEKMSLEEISKNFPDKTLMEIMQILFNMEIDELITQQIGIGYKLK